MQTLNALFAEYEADVAMQREQEDHDSMIEDEQARRRARLAGSSEDLFEDHGPEEPVECCQNCGAELFMFFDVYCSDCDTED